VTLSQGEQIIGQLRRIRVRGQLPAAGGGRREFLDHPQEGPTLLLQVLAYPAILSPLEGREPTEEGTAARQARDARPFEPAPEDALEAPKSR
jgi:hypothetical protein